MRESFRPLAGLKVVAWEQAVSLPLATRFMADLGATVVRVESHTRVAPRPRYLGNDLARNKLSVAVDLRTEQGREVVRNLVQQADVFCENFTPRVQRQFGLTYDELSRLRPGLIMLSLTGYGQTGPWANRPTYGPGIEAASGHAMSAGYGDGVPARPGTIVYADNISGMYALFALLAALNRRRQTGAGSFIDLAMYEALAFHLSIPIARSSLSGQPHQPQGNRNPAFWVQGVYPTSETERWIAVSIRDDQKDALAAIIGGNEASEDSLQRWLRGLRSEDAEARLQSAGIAASRVQNAKDVFLDQQLLHRDAFTLVQHAQSINGYGAHPHAASPWVASGRERPTLREAPSVGQHTREVLRSWLQMDEAAIEELFDANVVGSPAADDKPLVTRPSEERVRRHLDWHLIAGFDSEPGRVLELPGEILNASS